MYNQEIEEIICQISNGKKKVAWDEFVLFMLTNEEDVVNAMLQKREKHNYKREDLEESIYDSSFKALDMDGSGVINYADYARLSASIGRAFCCEGKEVWDVLSGIDPQFKAKFKSDRASGGIDRRRFSEIIDGTMNIGELENRMTRRRKSSRLSHVMHATKIRRPTTRSLQQNPSVLATLSEGLED